MDNNEKFKELEELEKRSQEEENDATEAILPPADIVAFTEQRSCADLYRMYVKKQIDINPDFQRGEVWSKRAQTLFIDSLIKQLPIPSMCISLDISTAKRLVIDGLQRITSIIKFLDESVDWQTATIPDVDLRISGKKTSEIRRNNAEIFDLLENVTIPITVLRCNYDNPHHMDYLFQIFYRLNTGANKLYNQEIRNCIFSGPFNNLLKELSHSESWLSYAGVDTPKVEKSRLSHEEQILRFFAFYENYGNYNGKLATFLNEYMKSKKKCDDASLNGLKDLFFRTLDLANKIDNKPDSKYVTDAILVGIAKNLAILGEKSTEEINKKYQQILKSKAFSAEEIQEGLAQKGKTQTRISTSIELFNHD